MENQPSAIEVGVQKALERARATQVVETPQPVEQEVIQPEAPELMETPQEVAVEQPQETPVVEEVVVEQPLEVDFDEPTFETPTAPVVTESFVKKHEAKLKELGFEAKDEDDLIEKLRTYKESQVPAFADPIVELANELAKEGVSVADYMAFQKTDFTKVADETLIRQELMEMLGNEEEVENALAELTPTQIKLQAKRYRQSLMDTQRREKEYVESRISQRKERYESGLREAFSSIDTIAGVKVQPTHKEALQRKLSGKSFEQVYLMSDGKLDPRKVAEAAAKIEYFNNVAKVAAQKGESKAKREVIENLSNVQPIDKSTSGEAVAQPIPKHEQVKQWLREKHQPQSR